MEWKGVEWNGKVRNRVEHEGKEGNRAKGMVAMGIDGISYLSNRLCHWETVVKGSCPGHRGRLWLSNRLCTWKRLPGGLLRPQEELGTSHQA